MKKKGFTLIELLVVISIIALLMAILMPTLAKVRDMARRAVCSANLGSLHKSFVTYAHDNHEDYPRAGGKRSRWQVVGNAPVFYAETEVLAYQSGSGSYATIGASLYYLIKYADAAPKEYLCGGDSLAVEFELSLYNELLKSEASNSSLYKTQDISYGWDFGGKKGGIPGSAAEGGIPPAQHYSYSYQMPYGGVTQMFYSLSTNRQPEIPVMADRNPYLVLDQEERPPYEYGTAREKWGNSPNHKFEGQNVLFNDSSTKWQTIPYCGLNEDNIYSIQTDSDNPQIGTPPSSVFDPINALPQNGFDSLLLNEGKQAIIK